MFNFKKMLPQAEKVVTTEAVKTKNDPFGAIEHSITSSMKKIIQLPTTKISLETNHKNCLITNKAFGIEIYISKTRQRIVWNSDKSSDTIPTSEATAEKLIQIVKDKLDADFSEETNLFLNQRVTNAEHLLECASSALEAFESNLTLST